MQDFWLQPLKDLNTEQWEQLCDHCGRCCTLKLEDEDTGDIFDTDVVCRYFDQKTSACTCYDQRTELVPNCVKLTPNNVDSIYFMPKTCSYRLRLENKPLYPWHHLISHNDQSIIHVGVSIKGRVISEAQLNDDLSQHIIETI